MKTRALALGITALAAAACGRSSGPPRVHTAALVVGSGFTDTDASLLAERRAHTQQATTTTSTAPVPAPAPVRPAQRRLAPPQRLVAAPAAQPVAQSTGGRSGSFVMTCYGPPEFPAGQHTATGAGVGPGSLAVDPRVIPYGSHVHIAGWGDFVANDTGGAIKGHRLDMWRSSCSGFPNPTVAATW